MWYQIDKGDHFSLPRTPKFFLREITGWFYLDQLAEYDLKSVDQGDWNKLTGISFNPLKPDSNAIMVGWRYSTEKKCFQVAPYFNVNSARIQPKDPEQVINVGHGKIVDFRLDYSGMNFRYQYENYKFFKPSDLKTNYWSSFRIQPWFGGNMAAPNNIKLFLKFN